MSVGRQQKFVRKFLIVLDRKTVLRFTRFELNKAQPKLRRYLVLDQPLSDTLPGNRRDSQLGTRVVHSIVLQ